MEQEYLGLDEKIARDYLASGEIDLVINIVDASNLQRNLVLTQQLLERELPTIIALNMLDVGPDFTTLHCTGLMHESQCFWNISVNEPLESIFSVRL